MDQLGFGVILCLTVFGASQAQIPIGVLPGEMPHHVSVQFHNSFWGTYENSANGIILDETHVLTVTPYWPIEDLSVVSGITHLLSSFIGLGERHTIKNVIRHPNYTVCYDPYKPNPNTPKVNNLFIIEVVEPFNFSTAYRKPARLPTADLTLPESGVVASWASGGLFDDGLKKITIPILNNSHCEDFYGKYRIKENMFCGTFLDEAGESYDVIDSFDMGAVISCREDPEDPQSPKVICGLMEKAVILNTLCQEPSGSEELGSNGDGAKTGCKVPQGQAVLKNYPLVFTNISKYIDWINEILNQNKK